MTNTSATRNLDQHLVGRNLDLQARTRKGDGAGDRISCPGGGYSQLSIANGHNTCKWFAENGIVGVMLKYRLPNGHSEVPLNDLDKAVADGARNAGELGVDPHKVGVAGTIGRAAIWPDRRA